MVLNKYTGSVLMDGSEDDLFKVFGTTLKHFASYVYLKALQAGEQIRLRVYNKVDDVSYWKLDGDVTDSVGGNNGTVTNISSFVSQWKFDGNVNDSVGANNGTITYHTNLKRLYKFESNLNDSTTSAANGTLAAGTATYVTGQEGNSFSFDGSSYITASDTGLPTGTGNISVSTWMKLTSFGTQPTYFGYGTTGAHTAFYLFIIGSGLVSFYDGTTQTNISTTSLSTNTWYHISVTYDGTNARTYINGVLDKTTAITVNTSLAGATGTTIGAISGGTNKFTGLLDELRTYDIALSQAQVSALYMNGKFGQSHTFDSDGTNGEYVDFGNPSNLQFERTNTFSIFGWVKTTQTAYGLLFGKINNVANLRGYGLYINPSGGIRVQIASTYSTNALVVDTSATFNDGDWHHVGFTYDGSSTPSGIKTYIDGVNVSNSTAFNSLSATINHSVSAKSGNDLASDLVVGQIDELRVYNAVLSASQVLGLYNYTGSNFVTPLPTGNALSLDGSSYVTVTNQTPYNFERTDPFSISFWWKGANVDSKTFISKVSSQSASLGWSIDQYSGNNIDFELSNTNVTNDLRMRISNATIFDGNYHNIIWTYDGSSTPAGIKMYLDGVSQSLTTIYNTLSATIKNSSNVTIGASADGTGKISGILDEVQIYNYVLSSAEIFNINAGRFTNTHPIGLWHFDGDLYDYSGQGSTGSPTGTMTYVTGALSGSYNVPNTHLNFDGSEYVDSGTSSNLNFERTQPLTITAWVRTTNNASQQIVSKFQGVYSGWYGGISPSGYLQFQEANINNFNDFTCSSATATNDGLWHFVAITYDGSGVATGVKFYVDSVLGATNVGRNNLTGSILNTAHITLGSLDTSMNNPFVGEIDDLRVYNRALSAGEVLDLFNYPDSPMKELIYDRTYSGVKTDVIYVPMLQGNQYKVTCQQTSGTNRIIPFERWEVT